VATYDEIRREAERRAGELSIDDATAAATSPEEREALIHELHVHQIELELQNEELRRTQQMLERSRAEYMSLYDEAPVGYLSLDANGVVIRANRTFAAQIGRGNAPLANRHIADFLAGRSREAFLRRFGALYREPEGKSIDAWFRADAGGEVLLHLSARRTDGGALRVAAVDVTERRRTEARVQELLAQKELLLREISHRTKNNYQTVLAMLELQSNLTDDEHVVASIDQAESRIRAMMLVQESLSETETDAKTEISRYLTRLLERIVSAFDPNGTVTIVTRLESGYADADTASAIGLVLNELATNAWKHALAAKGSGRLEVTLSRSTEGWTLLVADDGASRRTARPVTRASADTGLGETLVKALSSQLGAIFDRESTPDGTRCRLRLPPDAIESTSA